MFHAVPKRLEANAGITNEILGNLIFIQPTTVTVMEGLWEIPVI